MPGIAGILSPRPVRDYQEVLRRMVESLNHETFYRTGVQANEALGLWVGWACREGSFSDCLPIWNERSDICLIFSGEHFCDASEVLELRKRGHRFQEGDASLLVHLYEELGLKFLEKLNGWYSGVLMDLRKEQVVLFNDRYGLGRLYLHEGREGLYFASEAKALLRVVPRLRRLDPQGLAEFFSCGCVLQGRTLFPGVSLLPGGASWVFPREGAVRRDLYFHRGEWESQSLLSAGEYYERLAETFARVLPRYFRSQQPVAMSLTGGLDSRMIMACLPRPAGSLRCFTFGGRYRDCADVRIGRRVAAACGQPFETIPVGGEFLSRFSSLAEKTVYVTDGCMDVSGAVEMYVNETARGIAPVRMTGNYGGEILRRLIAFKPGVLDGSGFQPEFAQAMQSASSTYRAEAQGHRLSFVAFKQVPWHHYARLAVEQSQLTLRSPYLDNELVGLAYRAPDPLASTPEMSLRLIRDHHPALARIPTDRGVADRPTPVISRMRRLCQELTFKAEYAYDYGMPHWLANVDRLLSPLKLERLFLGRHKFYHFRIWYRDSLSAYLREILLDARALGRFYVNDSAVQQMVRSHTEGRANFTVEFHKLLAAEILQRQLID